jgi:hypothetical protein
LTRQLLLGEDVLACDSTVQTDPVTVAADADTPGNGE